MEEIFARLAAEGRSVTIATTDAPDFERFWDPHRRAGGFAAGCPHPIFPGPPSARISAGISGAVLPALGPVGPPARARSLAPSAGPPGCWTSGAGCNPRWSPSIWWRG